MLTVDKLVELGLFSKGEDGKLTLAQAQAAAAAKTEPNPAEVEWRKKFESLENQMKADKDALTAEKKRNEENARNTAVMAELTKAGAMRPDRDYVHIINSVSQDANGNYVVAGKDKYGMDTTFSVGEYVEKFLGENPELKKMTAATGGSGANPNKPAAAGTPQTHNGKEVVPKAKWTDAAWFMANQDKILKGEILLGKE